MKRWRFSEAQVAFVLRQAEEGTGRGGVPQGGHQSAAGKASQNTNPQAEAWQLFRASALYPKGKFLPVTGRNG